MKITTDMKVAEHEHYKTLLDHYPDNLCITPALHLMQANTCVQDLPLAIKFYKKYMTSKDAVANQMLDCLESHIVLIKKACDYINIRQEEKAQRILAPLENKSYGIVFRLLAIISEERGEIVLANEYYLNAAELTDAYSAYILGNRILSGLAPEIVHDSEKDYEAACYFSYAAKLGDKDASIKLASLYEKGIGVKESLFKALEIYQQMLGYGHVEVQKHIDRVNAEISKLEQLKSPAPSSVLKPIENSPHIHSPKRRRIDHKEYPSPIATLVF